MELSRLQSGSLAIEKQVMPIDDLLADVCERYASMAAEHGLSFDVKGDFAALPEVYTNPDRVEQLMVILLDNAIKYTEKGGLTVSFQSDEKKVSVSVADTGIGIPEDEVNRIFERFYRVDKTRDRETGGTGLGLSITYSTIMMHKGSIKVNSKEEEGTTILVRIPLKQSAAQ